MKVELLLLNSLSYDKNLNLFEASGDVKIIDKIKDYIIFAEKLIIIKKELITTFGNTKATISQNIFLSRLMLFFQKNATIVE